MISHVRSVRPAPRGRALESYRRVELAREGDGLLFRMAGGSMHVGYALDNRDMLHLEADAQRSCIETWRSSRWLGKLEGIYRYGG
jgi:hypothetical protein